jgi:hypothetical protein
MWNMKCFVISVLNGAMAVASKGLKTYLGTIPGQHSIDSQQQIKPH